MPYKNPQQTLSLAEPARPAALLLRPEDLRIYYTLPEGGCFQIPLPESTAGRQHPRITDLDWHLYLGSR